MATDWDRLLYGGYAGGAYGGGDNGDPVGEEYSALMPGTTKGYEGTAGKYSNILMNPFQYQGPQQYILGQVSGQGDNGDLTGEGYVANPEYSQEAYDAAKAEYMKNPTFNATRIRSGSGDDNNYQTANMKIETGPDGQQYLVPEGDWTNTTKRSGNVFSDIANDPKLQLFLAAVTAGVGGAALGGASLAGEGAAAGLGAGSAAEAAAMEAALAGGGEAASAFALPSFEAGTGYTLGADTLGAGAASEGAAGGYFGGAEGLFAGADAAGLTGAGGGLTGTLTDLAKKYGPDVLKKILGSGSGGTPTAGGGMAGGGGGSAAKAMALSLRNRPDNSMPTMIDPNYRGRSHTAGSQE